MKLTLPFHIEFGIGASWLASQLDAQFHAESSRVLIITGAAASRAYADRIQERLTVFTTCMQIREGTISQLHDVEATIRGHDHTHLLSIGGGRVGDFAKRLALLSNLRLLLVPTIMANDGLVSPIAVLRDQEKTVSLAAKMPDAVFIDLEALRAAPTKYLVAAACDLASNLSATNDWIRFSPPDAHAHSLANYLSQAAADGIIWSADWDVRSH